MTAVTGGSIRFVSAVLLPSEVQEMYAHNLGIDTNRKASDALATYARLEYGTSDATWLLVGLRKARTPHFARLRRWAADIRKPRDATIAKNLAVGVTE